MIGLLLGVNRIWAMLKPILARVWPYLLGAAVIIGTLWYIHHAGVMSERARQEQRRKEDAAMAEAYAQRIEQAVSLAVQDIDQHLGKRMEAIRAERTVIVQSIEKELRDDPRYSSAECSLSPGVFNAVNRARLAYDPSVTSGGSVTVSITPAS